MFGWGKVTCVLCNVQGPRKGALRSIDRKDVAVCQACYEHWYRDGRTCVACRTPVRVTQEVGVFLDRHAFGHADCGSVRLTS